MTEANRNTDDDRPPPTAPAPAVDTGVHPAKLAPPPFALGDSAGSGRRMVVYEEEVGARAACPTNGAPGLRTACSQACRARFVDGGCEPTLDRSAGQSTGRFRPLVADARAGRSLRRTTSGSEATRWSRAIVRSLRGTGDTQATASPATPCRAKRPSVANRERDGKNSSKLPRKSSFSRFRAGG